MIKHIHQMKKKKYFKHKILIQNISWKEKFLKVNDAENWIKIMMAIIKCIDIDIDKLFFTFFLFLFRNS